MNSYLVGNKLHAGKDKFSWEVDMRKLLFLFLFGLVQFAVADVLVTVPECATTATFLGSPESNAGILEVNGQLFMMDKIVNSSYNTLFRSRDEDFELGKPTYEVLIPLGTMSVLPTIVISYSGVQYRCDMDYVNEVEYDEAGNNASNVGSIGHGSR